MVNGGDDLQRTRVFLSYARADETRATRLAKALITAGHDVWWDTAIGGGAAFAKTIARELEAADAVVVAWSAAAVESVWVLDEASAGRDRERLVPIQLDTTPPPLGFRQLQTINLTKWRGRVGDPQFAALVVAVARVAGHALPGACAAPSAPSWRPSVAMVRWVVATLLILVLLAGGSFLARRESVSSKPVVAVLPFTDMSGAPAQAYFAEGLAEEILDTLSHDNGLKVLGSITARAIRDNSADPHFARNKLGVTRLLEGSVRGGRGSDVVRVSVRLIDTDDGSEIWSRAFERSGADVAAVQREVAIAVAAQIHGLGPANPLSANPAAPVPAVAYEKVLVARQLLRTRQSDAILRALDLANEAVMLAPRYAAAYAARSHATTLATLYSQVSRSQLAPARRDAETAIRLEPTLADGYSASGLALLMIGDTRTSIIALEQSLALNPRDAEARLLLGRAFRTSGNVNQAIVEFQKAAASDPLWSNPVNALTTLYCEVNQVERARDVARRYRSITPDLAYADLIDGEIASASGDYARAIKFAAAAVARKPTLARAQSVQAEALCAMFACDRVMVAARALSPADYWLMAAGDAPAAVASIQADGKVAWGDPLALSRLAYLLVQLHREADAVRAFDAHFDSAAAYTAGPVSEPQGALSFATSFDKAGRRADAQALRSFVRGRLMQFEASGGASSYNALTWAFLLLSEGDRDGALARLEAGARSQWWQTCQGPLWLGEMWWFAPLRGDPRFEGVKHLCRTRLNSQRSAAGLSPIIRG